ncbi:MAG: adenylate/guanylate cyclase domain-containing protein [Acidobacteriota bacterium]
MQKRFNQILTELFGEPRQFSLEHRLFNTLSLISGVANLGGAFRFLDFNNQNLLFILHVISGLVFLVFYFFARLRGSYRKLFWPFIIGIQIFLFVNTLINAGTLGGAHYYFIPALVIAIILAPAKRSIVLAFAISCFFTLTIIFIEVKHPELIAPHLNNEARVTDIAINLLFVQIFTGILVLVLTKNLNQERRKSDKLLLNILPASIADELKARDAVEPKHYESVTIMFTDFVGFTQIAEQLSPQELIRELDDCFREFDRIANKHGLEKIKTIGDAYMAVGGIPMINHTHAMDCLDAALEILALMQSLKAQKQKANKPFWQIRIGIHSGSLVAGVIGHDKFAYDVWGDTVNTASRLESSGVAGRINISGATYEQIKEAFECEYRGKIAAKNKGEIDMYFVNGVRQENLIDEKIIVKSVETSSPPH